jgi:hypothetical protein
MLRLYVYLAMMCSLPLYPISLTASLRNDYIIVQPQPVSVGMFAIFSTLAGFLFLYDRGCYAGVSIDCTATGAYYEPAYGPDWWEYYCEPLALGKRQGAQVKRSWGGEAIDMDLLLHSGVYSENYVYPYALPEFYLSRKSVFELIQKYIKIKPHLLQKIDSFVEREFTAPLMFGVHYRGTDKSIEAARVSYQQVLDTVYREIQRYSSQDYKMFVATDEHAFLEYMQQQFPHRICYQQAMRSVDNKPLHLSENHPYRQGEEALIDCLLLSRCDCLIRTSSNLSLWSSFFNPNMPVIPLSHRKPGPY